VNEGLPNHSGGGTETILVVEDVAAIRNGLRRLLEPAGYTVLTASTPTQAIELAADHEVPIHLLLTDVMLPGLTGRQLAGVLVRGRPGLRVLYMSGYSEADLASLGQTDPDASFLQKPFAVETLLLQVREALNPERRRGDAAS
jgi:DNA-binding NtrC family response regulator